MHVENHLAVGLAGSYAGSLDDSAHPVALSCPGDTELATLLLDELRVHGVHVLGVTFGSNDAAQAEMPLDWGALVPLWHLGGRWEPPLAAVVVSSSRERTPAEHVEAGRAIAAAASLSGKRVALIASADHGHAHDAEGPYGYDPAAAEYDRRIVECVRGDRLGDLLELDLAFVEAAKADSYWQLLVLHGAVGDGWRSDLLSYEAPTYFGMLCASYARE